MGISFVLRITSSEVHNLLHTRSLCNSTDIVEDLLCAEHCSHCDLSKDGHALLPQCPGVLSAGRGSARCSGAQSRSRVGFTGAGPGR